MPRKSLGKPVTPADLQMPDVEIAVAGARPRRKPRVQSGLPNTFDDGAGHGGSIPRISRLMALAIKFDDMTARGEVRDYADLARLGYVTRARMTQIMNLLHLAPDLQEEILFLDDPTAHMPAERDLRPILVEALWDRQRWLWRKALVESIPSGKIRAGSSKRESPIACRDGFCERTTGTVSLSTEKFSNTID